jgi:Ca2+/Na+ antiporter
MSGLVGELAIVAVGTSLPELATSIVATGMATASFFQ